MCRNKRRKMSRPQRFLCGWEDQNRQMVKTPSVTSIMKELLLTRLPKSGGNFRERNVIKNHDERVYAGENGDNVCLTEDKQKKNSVESRHLSQRKCLQLSSSQERSGGIFALLSHCVKAIEKLSP